MQFCSLTDLSCQRVLASLLVELLFLRGQNHSDALDDIPRLFQQHLGFSLPLGYLKLVSVSELMELPEIQTRIQVR